jgi:signal transduction histidine kinase
MASPAMMHELFEYVGFDERDAALLARLADVLRPAFPAIVDEFYDAIAQNEQARAVFRGGAPQIERQKHLLGGWLEGIVGGTYDEAYFERRARIGRVHVQIELDQRFMFSAMNRIRAGLHRALSSAELSREERVRGHVSIDRICDVELAIMLETYRERYVERQRANERLATIGQLAASIGHELRNPLAVMETSLHLLRRRVDDEGARRHFDKIGQQLGISGAIIEDLLELARDRPPRREDVALDALARDALEGVPRSEGAAVSIEMAPELPRVWVDGSQLRQVLVNLISNALQAIAASGRGARVVVGARVEASGLELSVTDDGPGFPAEIRGRLFEPLVTTRRSGAGLGLALCKRIVERHGGTIEAQDVEGGGARVLVRIPLVAEAA